MADFTPVAAQIRPPQAMSLADMVNLARGTQEYQQAQQMNPLALQIRQQEAQTGALSLAQAEQVRREQVALQGYMATPERYMKDDRYDLDALNRDIPKIAPLTGTAFLSNLTTLANAQTQATEAMQKMSQAQREQVGRVFLFSGRAGETKDQLAKRLDALAADNPNNSPMRRLIEANKVGLAVMPSDINLSDQFIKHAQSMMPTEQQEQAFAPRVAVTPEGRTVTTQARPGAAQPAVTFGVAGGVQAGAPAAPSAPTPSGGMPYPVRSAAVPYIEEPTEKQDRVAGESYRTGLVNRQTGLTTDRRNVEETINKIDDIEKQLFFTKGGVAGDIERKIRTAISSEDYKTLSKDLANLQMSNLRALGQGGNTVAGMDLTRVASGDESVPTKTLREIARRAQADMTNIDMQAKGAQAFQNRFGDNNMKRFQQDWSANADSKIFQAINIMRDIDDPVRREREFKVLFPRENQRQEFLKKYQNLRKLSETGGL